MPTKDYAKTLPSGRVLAKRSYAYYLYDSMEALQFDDDKVAQNLEHLRRGEETFNRAEWGGWIVRSGRCGPIMEYETSLCVVEEALYGN